MRRVLALLLMILLPLQVSWSIAAEYGTHGATLAAPHAELHVPSHAHADSWADAHGSTSASADEAPHAGCCDLHQCHTHGSFAALTATAPFTAVGSAAVYTSEPPCRVGSREAARIERPKWAASPIPS